MQESKQVAGGHGNLLKQPFNLHSPLQKDANDLGRRRLVTNHEQRCMDGG